MATSILPSPVFSPRTIVGGDLNDYKSPGYYTWTNASASFPANLPANAQSYMIVYRTTRTRILQIVFAYSGAASAFPAVYYRWFIDSAWSAWAQMLDSGNRPAQVELLSSPVSVISDTTVTVNDDLRKYRAIVLLFSPITANNTAKLMAVTTTPQGLGLGAWFPLGNDSVSGRVRLNASSTSIRVISNYWDNGTLSDLYLRQVYGVV